MKINQIKNVVLPLLLLFCLIGCSEDKEPQTYPPTLVTNLSLIHISEPTRP